MAGQQDLPFLSEELGLQNVKSVVPDPTPRQTSQDLNPGALAPSPKLFQLLHTFSLGPDEPCPLSLPFRSYSRSSLTSTVRLFKRVKLNFFLHFRHSTHSLQPSMPQDPSSPLMTTCDSGTSSGHLTWRLRPRGRARTSLFGNLI